MCFIKSPALVWTHKSKLTLKKRKEDNKLSDVQGFFKRAISLFQWADTETH